MFINPFQTKAKRRRKARSFAAYKDYISAPVSLGSSIQGGTLNAFIVPQIIEFGIGFSSLTTVGQITINVGGKTFYVPGSGSGFVNSIGVFEKGESLVIHRSNDCPSGTLGLYVYADWRKPYLVASGIFA